MIRHSFISNQDKILQVLTDSKVPKSSYQLRKASGINTTAFYIALTDLEQHQQVYSYFAEEPYPRRRMYALAEQPLQFIPKQANRLTIIRIIDTFTNKIVIKYDENFVAAWHKYNQLVPIYCDKYFYCEQLTINKHENGLQIFLHLKPWPDRPFTQNVPEFWLV